MEQQQKPKAEGEKKIEKYVFSLKKVIGQGAYATVYLGRVITTSEPVAVKVIDKQIFANAYNLKNIQQEIEIMKKIDHENIVRLLDVYQTSNNMYIITQLCDEGDLSGWLKRKKKASEKDALKFLRDIVSGFEYLVDREITHRDLKPANILLKDNSCKISDFGFAKNLEYGQNTVMRSIVGTPLYMSPQILSRTKYTNKSDIWSIGLIYYELLHGYTPWPAKNEMQLVHNIMNRPITFDASVSQKSRDFIKSCLKIKEEDRISWEEIFNHPLIKPVKKLFINLEPRSSGLVREDSFPKSSSNKENNINTMNEPKAAGQSNKDCSSVSIFANNNITIMNNNSNNNRDRSTSSRIKRDISENNFTRAKPKLLTLGAPSTGAPKTPTRTRLGQVLALDLTPKSSMSNMNETNNKFLSRGVKCSKPMTSDMNKTESSVSLKQRAGK